MILDTCALLWLAGARKELSKSTRTKIENAPVVYLSAISGFEIGLKSRAGKLILPAPPREWLQTVVEHHDLTVVPLSMDICVMATELPSIHRDPCDRFIIATAKIMNCPVITSDRHFETYGVQILF